MGGKEAVDYFKNHELVVRWPFTIYHNPILASLQRCIAEAELHRRAPRKVLVFGCGFFHEHELFRNGWEIHLVDQDDRLMPRFDALLSAKVVASATVIRDAKHLGEQFPDAESFDLVMAKEVIEHIEAPQPFLATFHRMLRPGGSLWLSTPNYGDWVLPTVENTLLELVARTRGFSRRDMHPNKYDASKFSTEIRDVGFSKVEVKKTLFKLALVCTARK